VGTFLHVSLEYESMDGNAFIIRTQPKKELQKKKGKERDKETENRKG
jgi:hypothetical protein